MQRVMQYFRHNRREACLLILILGLAAFLRLYMLGRFPPGLYFDEAADAFDALETLRTGHWPAFYDSQGGKEALWFWLLAIVFWIAGFGILQMRILAALVGILTVGAVWWAARELFSVDDDGSASDLALLSAAAIATLFVHVHFSRDGYRLLTQPLVGSLALGALWRGLRTRRWGWFLAAGALLGLAMYTYAAARFYLVLLAAFFLLEWVLAQPRRASMLVRYLGALAGMAVMAVVAVIPMGLHLLENPELILHRPSEVSVFSPTWNQGQAWSALLDSVWRNYAGLVWKGTLDTHWNIPGRPLLDILTIPLFLLGIVASVRRWRRPAYLFLLLWLVILYLPAVLSYDRVPTFHRSQGATPAAVMLVAVGARTAWRWLVSRGLLGRWGESVTLPLAVILLISGPITFRDYFLRWGPSWDAYLATQPYFLELVELMNADPEVEAVYLLPYDLRNGKYEHPDLKLFYHGVSPYISISDHEGGLLAALTDATAGRRVVRVVDWKVGRSVEADPKGLIPALLTMYGQPMGATADTPAYRIESFRLAGKNIDFRPLPPLQTVKIPLGDGLTLQGFAFGPTNRAELAAGGPLRVGEYAWVMVQWRVEGPAAADYKASVRLVDGDGVLAQQDKFLINGFHLGTTHWHPGEENYDVFILPLTQSGQYRLQVRVYDPETTNELVSGGRVLPGDLEVRP
jgi:4-amino-4-deoxy-L-arabinose transferase-like glycosyltransferase